MRAGARETARWVERGAARTQGKTGLLQETASGWVSGCGKWTHRGHSQGWGETCGTVDSSGCDAVGCPGGQWFSPLHTHSEQPVVLDWGGWWGGQGSQVQGQGRGQAKERQLLRPWRSPPQDKWGGVWGTTNSSKFGRQELSGRHPEKGWPGRQEGTGQRGAGREPHPCPEPTRPNETKGAEH